MKTLFYYKSEEAERLKQTYTSWIGREAHIGNGKKQMLKEIIILEHKPLEPLGEEKIFKVEFIFENENKLSAYEFLFYNSLVTVYGKSVQKSDSAV